MLRYLSCVVQIPAGYLVTMHRYHSKLLEGQRLMLRRLRRSVGAVLVVLILAVGAVLAGCGPSGDSQPADTPNATSEVDQGVGLPVPQASGQLPYILFNQQWVEGLTFEDVDLEDTDAMFWRVFSGLPDEVVVYPSENYYYFIIYVDGRQIWGNIRLPAGRRDRGVLSFAYFEYRESPVRALDRFSRNKFYTDADGLKIEEIDPFTYVVRYNGRAVTFNLNHLSQEPPNLFPLGDSEVFIERTFDESGYQYFLIFNEEKNYFLWVLNEEELVPDILERFDPDILVGRRSGFAFWVDQAHGNRKILTAILGQNATRNNYYDGPFDQLADNYVDQTRVSEYMIKASPSLEGRIDKYGYFMDTDRPSRVSISTYYVYWSEDALRQFSAGIRAADDPYFFISRRGVVEQPSAEPDS